MKYDCIAGYHMNPLTCGIAKFNLVLSAKMGIPWVDMYTRAIREHAVPLLSVKLSEFTPPDLDRLHDWMDARDGHQGFSVFLHGYDGTPIEQEMVERARNVYCGNGLLFEQLKPLNTNTHSLWCPGTNTGGKLFAPTDLTVFSFGMAHKLKVDKYYRLKELLEQTRKSYSIYLSTALHEGTTFDDSFNDVFREMRSIFGEHVYFMGYLSDQAVFNYLRKSDYFAAFFDSGVRANNTSVNAALESGTVVITNLDDHSPAEYEHMANVIDINQAKSLPCDKETLSRIGASARELGQTELGWDRLISRLA